MKNAFTNLPGQDWLLHIWDSTMWCDLLHWEPPCSAFCSTRRNLSWVPPPQVTEQSTHALHVDNWQLTETFCLISLVYFKPKARIISALDKIWKNMHYLPGQLCVLQTAISVLFPVHMAPPFAAGRAITLVLCWVPPPHVAEQDCDGAHSPQAQLTEGKS